MAVDMSGIYYTQYEKARKRAEASNEKGDYAESARAYRQCSEYLTQYARCATDPVIRAKRIELAQSYTDMAKQVAQGKPKPVVRVDSEEKAADDYTADIEALITKVPKTWDDVGGLNDTKREIKQAYGISMARQPEGVKVRVMRNMLFYGPPGTGKTTLAAAISNSLDATFFNVKVSNMMSKYFGESSKLITTLYTVAREHAPAVVFLDDVESLMPPRGGSGESGAERRVTSTLLVELDGLAQKTDDRFVLTIASTNLPWLIDKAMLSRFAKRIYIPLPDDAARAQILHISIEKPGYHTEVPISKLVQRTAGLSGREIDRACTEAINHMIERVNTELMDKVDEGREALENYQLRVAPLNAEDIEDGFGQTQPETTAKDLRAFEDWRSGLM